ncbi:MAG: four helix bundle protein [Moraxellaceae bacterium]|nr:four helix bundle protein [Pseudobdellovibrionaceae bacterium]
MKTFRTLDLAVEFYELILKIEVSGNLKDQLHRAASSIALNLSEGNAKGSLNEKRHFFQTAYGSFRECQTVFRLLKITEGPVLVHADRLGGCLYKLVNSNIKNSPNYRRSSDI